MNGRVDKNNSSKFTCFTTRGNSVVDYTLLRQENFSMVDKMSVGELCELSDHSPIEISIKSSLLINESETKSELPVVPLVNLVTAEENELVQNYKKQYHFNDASALEILSLAMDNHVINTFLKNISNRLDNDDLSLEGIIELLQNKMIDLSETYLSSRNFFHKIKTKKNLLRRILALGLMMSVKKANSY